MKEGIFVGPQITRPFEDRPQYRIKFLQKDGPGGHMKMSAENF
jgi:hypothetical protein